MDRDRCLAVGFDVDAFLATEPSTSFDNRIETSLYVVRCGEYVKVGIAVDIPKRVVSFQVGNPYPIEVVFEARFPSRIHALLVERTVHKVLADERHFGEWFVCEPARATEVAVLVSDAMAELAVIFAQKDEQREAYWREKYDTDPKFRAKIDAEREASKRDAEMFRRRDDAVERARREFNDANRDEYPVISEQERVMSRIMSSIGPKTRA